MDPHQNPDQSGDPLSQADQSNISDPQIEGTASVPGEADLLAVGQAALLDKGHSTEDIGQTSDLDPAQPAGEDLLSEDDLKGLMAQFNPHASKDLEAIQKGVENFFLFHQDPHALLGPDGLQHLGSAEQALLIDRKAFTNYHYLRINPESDRLETVEVLIRPASLKADQVARVKMACVRASALAFLIYTDRRDEKSKLMEADGKLGQWVSARFMQSAGEEAQVNPRNRQDLVKLMKGLHNLSVEHYLEENCKVSEELLIPMVSFLHRRADQVLSDIMMMHEPDSRAIQVLQSRGQLPFLIELSGAFHIIQPPGQLLIELKDGQVQENRSELEWIQRLYVQMARHILNHLLPEEDRDWLRSKDSGIELRLLSELQKHPSFLHGDDWEGGDEFVVNFDRLNQHVQAIRHVRREYLIQLVMEETINRLNMQFEPVLFRLSEFQISDKSIEDYIPRKELYSEVTRRMQSVGDVLNAPERRKHQGEPGIYFIFRSNMPRAFIENSKRRNFLHLFCRENGLKEGIYDLLIDVSDPSTPEDVVQDQIDLGKAIREWEEVQEKERLKKERAKLGFFGRLIDFFKRLFGMQETPSRRVDDLPGGPRSEDPGSATGNDLSNNNVVDDGRLRKKSMTIPAKVQKAIDYVERNNKGIIWVNEVVYALNSVKFNDNQIGDLLYYDDGNRYAEIRSVREVQAAYIQHIKLKDKRWLQSTIDYLENITKQKQEHALMIRYLRSLLDASS